MEEVLKACKSATVNTEALHLITWILPTRSQTRAELWRKFISDLGLKGNLHKGLEQWGNDMAEGLA